MELWEGGGGSMLLRAWPRVTNYTHPSNCIGRQSESLYETENAMNEEDEKENHEVKRRIITECLQWIFHSRNW